MKFEMNLNEDGNQQIDGLPEWYNPFHRAYIHEDTIDFVKVHDDFNQTKIKLFVLNICDEGWHSAILKSLVKIIRLYSTYDDRDSRDQKLVDKAHLKIQEEIKLYTKRKAEIVAATKETEEKFLSLQNDYESHMKSMKNLLDHEPEKKKIFWQSNSPCLPFNDPYNEFGWKDFCDLKTQIYKEYNRRIADAKSDEKLTRFRLFANVRTEDLPAFYWRREFEFENVMGELGLERDYKVNEAFLGFCKKYFQEDLSQPIYDGLAFYSV